MFQRMTDAEALMFELGLFLGTRFLHMGVQYDPNTARQLTMALDTAFTVLGRYDKAKEAASPAVGPIPDDIIQALAERLTPHMRPAREPIETRDELPQKPIYQRGGDGFEVPEQVDLRQAELADEANREITASMLDKAGSFKIGGDETEEIWIERTVGENCWRVLLKNTQENDDTVLFWDHVDQQWSGNPDSTRTVVTREQAWDIGHRILADIPPEDEIPFGMVKFREEQPPLELIAKRFMGFAEHNWALIVKSSANPEANMSAMNRVGGWEPVLSAQPENHCLFPLELIKEIAKRLLDGEKSVEIAKEVFPSGK